MDFKPGIEALAAKHLVMAIEDQAGVQLETTLELHLRMADGRREIVAIRTSPLDIAFPGGCELRFIYQSGKLLFKDLHKSSVVYKEGHSLLSGTLEIGTTLEVGSHRVLLWDTGVPVAFIKGCTPPFSHDIWPLAAGDHAIGRPGKRVNEISLDHPTVSREHARIVGREDGSFQLLAEAVTNPVYLKGEALSPGRTVPLRHGDLMEVGELIFRFHQPSDGSLDTEERACITVCSLGDLTVSIAGQTIPEKGWRTQQIKWLFSHLAYAWGRPLSTEALMVELWPDAEPAKAQANFKFSLSTLRQILRDRLPAAFRDTDTILRSSTTLQLNPDLLDRHDAVDLQRLALGTVAGENWIEDAQKAVLSYQAPFLQQCQFEWAAQARQELQRQVIDLAKGLLARLEQRESLDDVVVVAAHALELEPKAQWACLSLMRALRKTGRSSEALSLFEDCTERWHKVYNQEPEIELLQEQQLALATV